MIGYAFDPTQEKAKEARKTEASEQQVNNNTHCLDELTHSETPLRFKQCRSRLPRSLRHGSAAACLLGLRVRILPGA
jgi:hypothetical protein